jgi:hypothetical protein
MTKRYVLIDTDDADPSDLDFELGPVYDEAVAPPANSYVTESEAAAYFADNPKATAFLALASTAWYLQEATRNIDALVLRGQKYDLSYTGTVANQALEFPRYIDEQIVGDASGTAVVPDAVKNACMEEALAIYLAGTSGGLKDLQEQGVQSMSIGGKLSYSFVPGGNASPLLSAVAKRIMRRYMGAETR